jgi:integrase
VELPGHPAPPSGARKTWYAYWNGIITSRATGHKDFDSAAATAEQMLRDWSAGDSGERPKTSDLLLTDDEFIAIQKAHYDAKGCRSTKAAERAGKSLVECLGAVRAFQDISGLRAVAAATKQDCAAFQLKAKGLPRGWRAGRNDGQRLSESTIYKWSVALSAAFDRANTNAGRKCIRGVVDDGKLLTSNPWPQFRWHVEQRERPIRQFDVGELVSLLDHMEGKYAAVPGAAAYAKVLVWSALRKREIASLSWLDYRPVNGEHHFYVEAKSGVPRWFRVPEAVYRELAGMRVGGDDHVFAGYVGQLRLHLRDSAPGPASRIKDEYDPARMGDWFYERMVEWARSQPRGHAYVHTFRKTGLQFARAGEDINRRVAEDARVSEKVMLGHYVRENDPELRAKSNRTIERLAAAMPDEVARRYGHEQEGHGLEEQLSLAVAQKNWRLARELSLRLEGQVGVGVEKDFVKSCEMTFAGDGD